MLLKVSMHVSMVWFNFLTVILLMPIAFCFFYSFLISVIEHRDKSLFLITLPEVFSLS